MSRTYGEEDVVKKGNVRGEAEVIIIFSGQVHTATVVSQILPLGRSMRSCASLGLSWFGRRRVVQVARSDSSPPLVMFRKTVVLAGLLVSYFLFLTLFRSEFGERFTIRLRLPRHAARWLC